MPQHQFLAFDLGAESGRAMLGTLEADRLRLEGLHRFANQPVHLPQGWYWDAHRLFHELVHGLTVAGRQRKLSLTGIGVDTWGVDFALVAASGEVIENPRCYRDARTNGMLERTFAVVPKEDIFRSTGIQFMQINSLFQLHAIQLAGGARLRSAARLLFMPDLLNYWLCGEMRNEVTIASTSQIYNPTTCQWERSLLERLNIPAQILGDVVQSGTQLGWLLPHLRQTCGLSETSVYATASHDTASAVAAVPAEGDDWCYISSGTWSLMGVECDAPIINDQSLALNFTNEVGAGGKIRLLKNIAGLWPLQECRRAWALAGSDLNYDEITELASDAGPAIAIVDPDQFLEPGNMPQRIQQACLATGQPAPRTPGQLARVILESLAVRYGEVLQSLELLTGRRIRRIHIVGGGSRNHLLNRLVAERTGRTVVAGPAEATAAGNVLVQAIGAGLVKDLTEARMIVRASFPLTELS